jgi:hypothetical protein
MTQHFSPMYTPPVRRKVITRSQLTGIERTLPELLSAPPSQVEFIRVECVAPGAPLVGVTLDPAAVHALFQFADLQELQQDLATSDSADKLVDAVRAQTDLLEIEYAHDACDSSWTDTHSCACDSECPSCGRDIQASNWKALRSLEETERPGIFTFSAAAGTDTDVALSTALLRERHR